MVGEVIPCIFHPPLLNFLVTFFFREAPEFEISPMMQRSGPRTSEDQKRGCANYGDEIEWEEEYEFDDLQEGEWGVDGRGGGFAKHLDFVGGIVVEQSGRRDHIDKASTDQGCLWRTD